jgi:hypothetical protein
MRASPALRVVKRPSNTPRKSNTRARLEHLELRQRPFELAQPFVAPATEG